MPKDEFGELLDFGKWTSDIYIYIKTHKPMPKLLGHLSVDSHKSISAE